MIHFREVDEDNWRADLRVAEDQRRFVLDRCGLLARAYAYRNRRSRVRLICDGNLPVGMLLYYDWEEEAAYVFCQLFIDARYQRQGFGRQAVLLALDEMRADGRFDSVILCYSEGNEAAQRLYERLGFRPTGAVDGEEIVLRRVL
ncbi:MAG: GNAT family N-acetyltransferase [Clostridia bacterium]|nr:GNAT family N-acetyltransferase [Clostridia bacterium]